MIIHLAIRRPKPDNSDQMLQALHRLEQKVRAQPGVISTHTMRDAHSNTLVSIFVWMNKEAWLLAQPGMSQSEEATDFAEWEESPPEVYHLEET